MGVEDDKPPTKRLKVSSRESVRDQESCSVSHSMARLLASQEEDEVVGSRGVIKKVELVRIITEALYSLGFSKSGACLEEESGIPLHSTKVDIFVQQILDGKWDESVMTLHEIDRMDESIVKLASFTILEQKFFELLDGGKVMDALKTLRTEIAPICVNNGYKVRELSYYMVSPSQNSLEKADRESRLKSRRKLLEELQKLLPPTVIIPENRLVHLVEKAIDLQKDACRFHNSTVGDISLLTDHHCGRDQIPCQTLQILQEHSNEVWFLQFSHNGKYLASSSSDCLVIIWEVKADSQVSVRHRLIGHQKPVSYISWGLDDHQILSCGFEETIRRWDIVSGECLQIYEKSGLGFVSCGWGLDGNSIFSGVTDKSISMWDLEGKELECWKGQKSVKITDLGISSGGKELVTVCKDTTILLFNWETVTEKFIEESQTITSFVLSRDRKLLLVSLWNEELHLWDIDGCPRLVSKYKGHRRSRFVVRSCFGGLEQAFIASGSEDSQVYIWHRPSGELIMTLVGHSGAVNCVSWNPANPHMLASASDDRTIRIWGLNKVNLNCNGRNGDTVHYCNDKS
ncbi:transducin family protein / WD-40 repeat family protein [Striga hermonthica]|uniref:Transducin family protein / WD-40 repeat family protein n=1 Tax=Striga hermonthica TaxID=68872 RepID=A0A9N7RN25_STRHE|nr:transducin family protein / WD-40 repeat family protein [Striga hermonthica]